MFANDYININGDKSTQTWKCTIVSVPWLKLIQPNCGQFVLMASFSFNLHNYEKHQNKWSQGQR